eukprot:6692510-Alexandrium_andersonii.AAC.1
MLPATFVDIAGEQGSQCTFRPSTEQARRIDYILIAQADSRCMPTRAYTMPEFDVCNTLEDHVPTVFQLCLQ